MSRLMLKPVEEGGFSLRTKLAAKSAFTLVEVMMAVMIIGAGVIPVLSLFLTGSRTVAKGGVMLEASIAAQNILDRARSDSFIWANIPATISIPDPDYPEFYLPQSFVAKHKANGTLIIEEAPGHTIIGTGANETNLLQLTVLLHWIENGMPKEYRVLTYRANTNTINLKTSARF